MAKIYRFIPYTEVGEGYSSTHTARIPYDEENRTPMGVEKFHVIGDYTYFILFDGVELGEQSDKITIEEVVLTQEIKDELNNSLYIKNIDAEVRAKIAQKYSIYDELKLIRTAPSAEFELYNTYVEGCRDWGRNEKAKFGL